MATGSIERKRNDIRSVSDITTEALIPILADNPFGLCASYNEAAVFLGGMDAYRSGGNKDEGIYNDIFDGGYVQVNRKTGNQDTMAEHTHCSINGGIQPNSLKAILRKNLQFLFSGFLARFLLCMAPDLPRHFSMLSVPQEIIAAYEKLIETLFFWREKLKEVTPCNPYLVKLTHEAEELFADYYNTLADDRSSLPSGAMKASLSKLSGYVPRIALTLHVAHYASKCPTGKCPRSIPDVDATTMRSAITLVEWFRHETQRVLQIMQPSEVIEGDKEMVAILKHLADRDETTA